MTLLSRDDKEKIVNFIEQIIKATAKLSAEILINILRKKYFHFIEKNGIVLGSEKERLVKQYFEKECKKRILGGNKYGKTTKRMEGNNTKRI